jgi:hypothetical protein
MKNPDKSGGKGMLPLGCLPLWGREGITLLSAAENKRITGKRGFQQSRDNTKNFYRIKITENGPEGI